MLSVECGIVAASRNEELFNVECGMWSVECGIVAASRNEELFNVECGVFND